MIPEIRNNFRLQNLMIRALKEALHLNVYYVFRGLTKGSRGLIKFIVTSEVYDNAQLLAVIPIGVANIDSIKTSEILSLEVSSTERSK